MKIKKLNEYDNNVSEEPILSTMFGKNIISDKCQYYGFSSGCFVVYNIKEDWYIHIDSPSSYYEKGITARLEDRATSKVGGSRNNIFLGYGDWELKEEKKITQEKFLKLLKNLLTN